jgi:ABC-2 type transport system ATP-binding protein
LPDSIISAAGLTRAFGPEAGVFDMDLEIAPGLVIGFIGPSGSGKTTTVRLMTGILTPDSGRLSVLGTEPARFSRKTLTRIGYMPQRSILDPNLTLHQSLDFSASLYGMPLDRSDQIERIVEFVDLGAAVDRLPAQVSGGEQRRLMLASTLIHDPELIFLDEPTAGIDPVLRRRFWDRFEDLAGNGRTLIVTTQYVGEAAYCDYVVVLADGRVLAFDTPSGLRRTAFDGEMVSLTFEVPPGAEDTDWLQQNITRRPLEWLDSRSARAVVADAGTALPELARWADDRGIGLETAETYLPPFDDVFVQLIDALHGGDPRPPEAG